MKMKLVACGNRHLFEFLCVPGVLHSPGSASALGITWHQNCVLAPTRLCARTGVYLEEIYEIVERKQIAFV